MLCWEKTHLCRGECSMCKLAFPNYLQTLHNDANILRVRMRLNMVNIKSFKVSDRLTCPQVYKMTFLRNVTTWLGVNKYERL